MIIFFVIPNASNLTATLLLSVVMSFKELCSISDIIKSPRVCNIFPIDAEEIELNVKCTQSDEWFIVYLGVSAACICHFIFTFARSYVTLYFLYHIFMRLFWLYSKLQQLRSK